MIVNPQKKSHRGVKSLLDMVSGVLFDAYDKRAMALPGPPVAPATFTGRKIK